MKDKIICDVCKYACQDEKASEYSIKHCIRCELRDNCEICLGCGNRDNCKIRHNQKYKQSCDRRNDIICSKQAIKWTAIQCTNPKSRYYRALLNVTPSGNMEKHITWSGCSCGEKRRVL